MTKESLNINQITQLIPHRYPLLLVDKVTNIVYNKSITGIKNVTINEPHFVGHFPNRPVMPGVLIIEAMAQLSALLISLSMEDDVADKKIYLMSIEESKFRKIVEPGDNLIMHSTIVQKRKNVWKFSAYSKVEEILSATTNFTAMIK